ALTSRSVSGEAATALTKASKFPLNCFQTYSILPLSEEREGARRGDPATRLSSSPCSTNAASSSDQSWSDRLPGSPTEASRRRIGLWMPSLGSSHHLTQWQTTG